MPRGTQVRTPCPLGAPGAAPRHMETQGALAVSSLHSGAWLPARRWATRSPWSWHQSPRHTSPRVTECAQRNLALVPGTVETQRV